MDFDGNEEEMICCEQDEDLLIDAWKDNLCEEIEMAFEGLRGPFAEDIKDICYKQLSTNYAEEAYYNGVKPTIVKMLRYDL